jgi:hypothetical protein
MTEPVKTTHFVVDLLPIRNAYLAIAPEIRRPEVAVNDAYKDAEVFDMEVCSLVDFTKSRFFAGEHISRYAENIIDNFENNLEDDPLFLRSTISAVVRYANCVTDLGESLWQYFKDNDLYNRDGALVGEFENLVDQRWLVLRKGPPIR